LRFFCFISSTIDRGTSGTGVGVDGAEGVNEACLLLLLLLLFFCPLFW